MGKLRVLRIFKKKTLSNQLDSLEDKITDNFKPTKLEIAANIFTILGTAVSLVLAFWAINLTKKYGESKDQIIRLDSLISNQQELNQVSVDMLKSLKSQSTSLQNEVNELTKISSYSNDQMQILSKKSQRELQELHLQDTINYINFKRLLKTISDSLESFTWRNDPRGAFRFLDTLTNKQLWFKKTFEALDKIRVIILKNAESAYLINKVKIKEELFSFYSRIENLIGSYRYYYDFDYLKESVLKLYDKIQILKYDWKRFTDRADLK